MSINKILYSLLFILSVYNISAQDILMQDGTFNQCSGSFFDSGGASGNYSTGEDFTVTICPDDPTLITTLEFTEFDVTGIQGNTFEIYDGNTADPALLIGTFSGTLSDNPEILFVSASDQNPTGCLTIVFTSATFPFGSMIGWAANIDCREPCTTTTADLVQVEPSEFNTTSGNYEIGNFLPITFEIDPDFTSNNGTNPQYVWDFGDGSPTVTTTIPIVQHEFTALGNFNVTVNIIDDFGCSNENAVTIPVEVISRSGFTCDTAQPFCAGGEVFFFPNSSNAGGGIPSAENGPDYGCLNLQPFPAWFFVQIEQSGDIEFFLEQNTSQDFNGNGLDVDFKIWGPFSSASGNCDNLNSSTEVPDLPNGNPLDGCSYSAAAIETMGIPNAQAGEFYIIVITNFSQNQGFISFEQTNENDPGAGTTSCSILGDDIDACEDETVTVFTNVPGGDTFEWALLNTNTGNFDVLPGETGSSIDITQPGGTYQVTVSGPNTQIVDEITVNFFENPVVTTPVQQLIECSSFFDLTEVDLNALGVNIPTEFEILYFTELTFAEEGNPIQAIPDTQSVNYQATEQNEEIFVRVQNILNPNCFTITSFILVQDGVSVGSNFTDITECIPNGQPASFDLTINDNEALNGQDPNNFNVFYYDSQADANNNNTANAIQIPSNYEVSTPGVFTIYVNVENPITQPCFAVNSFQIEAILSPDIQTPPEDLTQCGDFTLTQTFDLTENNVSSLGISNPAETQLTYHNTQAEADIGDNPIPDPANYQPANNQETIFIRAENINSSDCFSTDSFTIEIFDVEILQPDDLGLCDDGSGTGTATFNLTENNFVVLGPNQDTTTHSVSYHETQADANGGSNPIPDPTAYPNTSNPQTIWVRVQNIGDPTNCFEIASFEISVTDSAPVNLNPPNIVECDDDNDGFFNNFDLSSQDDVISLANPDVQVSYHLTQSDAENNVGALSSPYSNVVESVQTIYFRTEDINNSCSLVSSFELQVVDSPILTPIAEPLSVCDDNTDGFLFFDLTQIEPEVLGSLDPTNLDITYHLNETDAETDQNEIAQPTNYQNTSSPQTIWVRVTDTSNAQNCYNIESFDIEVLPLPEIINPEPLAVCDDETGGDLSDEIATFDLNDKIDEITQGNNELNVEFFETPTDLTNNNPITPIDSYVNLINPQTIEVKVTSQTTGCEDFTTLTLVVNPVPSLAPTLEPLEVCDPDNDGFAEFDLDAAIADILNNEPEVTITFHLTQADADLGVNPIDTTQPFGTNNPNQQTLYVRAENTGPNGDDGTGCYDTRPLDLIVIPSPEIQNLEDLTRCDDETANGFASFDLTQNTPEALGNQDPTN
ncbi:PKD domain-containing protein, partial [Psychroflexus sp. MBR-150]